MPASVQGKKNLVFSILTLVFDWMHDGEKNLSALKTLKIR